MTGRAIVAALVALLFAGLVTLDYLAYKNSQETFIAQVTGKERVCETEYTRNDDGTVDTTTTCHNYIHTNRETLLNDGTLWEPHNAFAMQGRLIVGQEYQFKVYGKGNEAFGIYRKVIQVAKIIPGGGKTGGGGSSNW